MSNKMKVLSIAAILLGGIGLFFYSTPQATPNGRQKKASKKQRIEEAIKDNFERTKDLELGYPPVERLATAIEETRKMQKEFALQKNRLANARFRERGPKNIGGRTRTILIDKNDPSRRTIFVGGVTGGLWKSDDITAARPEWKKVNDYLENLSVGALAQDANDPQIMYMGTGEGYGNIAAGVGVFRSYDGGVNWELLPSTTDGSFRYTRSLLVHPSGDVYAGTSTGLYRSQDQGETWEKLRVVGAISNFYDLIYVEANEYIYASATNSVHRSKTGNSSDWEDLSRSTTGFPKNLARTELTVSPTNPEIMYILGAIGGSASDVFSTRNGGQNWLNLGKVGGTPDFTNGQAWYDLEIQVDPFNPQHVIASGVPIFRSLNGGVSWNNFAFNMHVDHHLTLFDEENPGVVYFGNDGGIYRSTNGSSQQVQNRNLDYNVTQFYAGAIHPDAFSNYILGGTQDNNSLQMDNFDVANARNVNGGDGMLCHIDQDEPQYQIVSSQFGNYVLTTDGGRNFSGGASVNGAFVNPSDYDNDANILYAQTFDADFARWRVPNGGVELINITNANPGVSVVYADPSTPNRIYLGTFGGAGLIRVDNADQGESVTSTTLQPGGGTISSVAVEKDDPDHILVTMSNYGLRNNIYESKDGGSTWAGVEGNLPDLPVRSCLFVPGNSQQAVIATEAGVWFTEQLNGSNTIWIPPLAGRGIPLVRTDMLQLRESDKVILAATHGRGMFTSDVFADPAIIYDVARVGYLNAPIQFLGEFSYGAQSFLWRFGDGETDTEGNTTHRYGQIGEYDVSFTLNDELTESTSIKILPDKATPYTSRSEGYSGGFENNPEDWGVHTISGSGFERGKSTRRGKDGTFSGDNAFVIGLEEDFYQPNSHSILYMPNFDLSEPGLYEFSFWYKAFLQDGFDGFLVEYSTDKGITWNVLGQEQQNWYTFTNDNNLQGAAFGLDVPYFARSRREFEQAYVDLSFLSGQKDVAFRFVFKSNDSGSHPGVVIDDVEVTRFEGALQTDIVNLSAEFNSSEEAAVSFTTQPEYFAQRFVLERSFNGRDYEEVEKIEPKGKVTARVQNYEVLTKGTRDLYFFRIRSINESPSKDYFFEFTTPPVIISRGFEEVEVFSTFPNPFTEFIEMTFTNIVEEPLDIELYDSAGRMVFQNSIAVDDVYTRIDLPQLPAGVYFLNYKIGDRLAKTVKLMKNVP
ncbi:MAG: T9SS type A sorting domain-containing protein [Bacteroidota bacterium]